MKHNTFLITAVSVAAFALCGPATVSAEPQETSPAPATSGSPAASPAVAGPKAIPFKGKVSAIDQSAKTFTVAGKKKTRVFMVTDQTIVMKNGSVATIADLAENERVAGSFWKRDDGTLEAKKVRIGGKKGMGKAGKKARRKSAEKPADEEAAAPEKE